MSFPVQRKAEQEVLAVDGEMTIAHAKTLKETMFGERSNAFNALDLSRAPAIDVTGVQLLLLFQRRHPGAFPLAATHCSERIADTLKRIGLDDLLVH